MISHQSSSRNVSPPWRIHLLGVLRVASADGQTTVTRFQTQSTGALLAYLAFHSLNGVAIPREVAIDAIWPDVSPISARNRFKIALSALRAQFAVPPFDKASVFQGDTFTISLNPSLFSTDVATFERMVKRAERTTSREERLAGFDEAVALYTGDLLLGRYESWVEAEQDKLRQRYEAAVEEQRRLTKIGPLTQPAPSSTINRGNRAPVLPTIPHALTRFFGRDGEIKHLSALLTQSVYRVSETRDVAKLPLGKDLFSGTLPAPLITLTGMGGIGKSRLATETARKLLSAFAGRIWFVELAEITDPKQIWVRLRDTLGLVKEFEANAPEQVLTFLSTTRALLVLDNMEQFVASGHAVEFVNALRSQLPMLSCLVTSRHVIGAYGEQILPVGSLLSPSDWAALQNDTLDAATLPIESCVALFSDRARAVSPMFRLDKDNSPFVHRLCETLEGIPLAIELAAARSNFLTPEQLLSHVEQRFAWLKSSRKDIPDRHRSLQAAVDTSYRLLSQDLQRIFRALSVFRGGWTLEAAAFVCGMEHFALWDALIELNERSLVQSGGGDARFQMLDTLRDFAASRLHEFTDEESAVRHLHWLHFAQLAAEAEPHIVAGAANQHPWLDRIEADHDNFRAAFAARASDSVRLRTATDMHRFWFLRGYALEGKATFDSSLCAVSDLDNSGKAKVWIAAGALAWAAGVLGEAQEHWKNALDCLRQETDTRVTASVLNNLGIVSCQNGYLEEGRQYYIESLDLYRVLRDAVHQSMVLTNLGGVLFYQENFEAARRVLVEGLEIQRAAGDQVTILRSLNTLAEVNVRLGDLDAASIAVEEGLSIRCEINDYSTLWEPLFTAAVVLTERRKLREAANVWGAMQALRDDAQMETVPAEINEKNDLRNRLAELDGIDNAVEIGRAMGAKRALSFARDALRIAVAPTIGNQNRK